jgi:hypothetical protein
LTHARGFKLSREQCSGNGYEYGGTTINNINGRVPGESIFIIANIILCYSHLVNPIMSLYCQDGIMSTCDALFFPRKNAPLLLNNILSVGTLQNGYLCKVPLPRVSRHQSPAAVAATIKNPHDIGYLPDPRMPWIIISTDFIIWRKQAHRTCTICWLIHRLH